MKVVKKNMYDELLKIIIQTNDLSNLLKKRWL